MRAVNDRLAFARERLNQRLEADRSIGVEAVQWFIEKNDGWIVQERGGDDDFSPHAFGVGAEEFVREGFKTQVEERKKLFDPDARGILRNAIKGRDHFQI